MDLIKMFGRAVDKAFSAAVNRQHKAAALNRIRTVIRCKEREAEKEYLALGRYYYNTLRDKGDPVAEPHCAALDKIEGELDAYLAAMQGLAAGGNFIGVIAAPRHSSIPGEDDRHEVIDLSDVEVYDEDPGWEAGDAQPEENSTLPFEG